MGIEEALGVWRGSPLGGVSAHGLLDGERARFEEERLAAAIEGIEIDLELGRHGELLGQLEALVIAHPFKERLVELQMLALYRCGRQADALAAFHAARARFVEELGIEPGQPLRELHQDVLGHADTLGTRTHAGAARCTGRPQVAGAAEPHDRPRARSRCDRRTASSGFCPAAHPDRPGRGWQDAARSGDRPRGRTGLRRRRVLRLTRRPSAARRRSRGDRQRARGRRPLRRVSGPGARTLPGLQAPAARGRQLRACPGRGTGPRRAARGLSGAHGPCDQSRAARAVTPRSATPYRRSRCPSAGCSTTRGRWAASMPSRCSASAREPTIPTFDAGRRQPRCRSGDLPAPRRVAAGDRADRRPLRTALRRRDRRAPGHRAGAPAPVPATRPPASRRCARRSTGVTNCSTTTRSSASRALPCSPAARRSKRPRPSPAQASTRSTTSWPRACSCAAVQANAPTRLGMLETIRALRRGTLRLRRRRARRARAPLPLLPRARPSPRNRAGAVGHRCSAAPRPARRRDRQPPCGARLGDRTGQRRTRARAGRSARQLLGHARPLRRCGGLDRPGAEPARRRRPSGPARPRSAHEDQVPVARGARSRAPCGRGRGWRPSPDGLATP